MLGSPSYQRDSLVLQALCKISAVQPTPILTPVKHLAEPGCVVGGSALKFDQKGN